jgi:membrane protease YdiL (CAAX protease family)
MNNTPNWPIVLGNSGVLVAGRWLRLRAILWAIFLSAGALGLFLSTQYLVGWLHFAPGSSYFIVLGIPLLALVGYGALVAAAERRRPVEVLPYRGMIADISIGALIGFILLCSLTALLWSLGLYQVQTGHWQHVFDSFVFNSYLSGMMEELLFRAVLLRILGRAFGLTWGLLLSALLFGVAHLTHGDWLAVVGIAINAGLTMGLLYIATGSIWMSIGLHTVWDFTEDSLLGVNSHNGLLRSTPVAGKPELLTGGQFGPDASVLSMVVGALLAAGIFLAWKKGLFKKKHPFETQEAA